jgi:hypothetical protein
MVDEIAFRQVLRSVNSLPCIFGKAIMANCCDCSMVQKHYLAERESMVCIDSSARVSCHALYQLLRHNAAFALKHIHDDDPLTHAQEMKLQCGGLLGLQYVVDKTKFVPDVFSLIGTAHRDFGTLETLPYSQIIQSIASFKTRKRRDTE